MKRLVQTAAIVVVGASMLVGASSASAALTWPQRVGDPCTANLVTTSPAVVALTNRGYPVYEVAGNAPPETPSVITRWAVTLPAGFRPLQEKLIAVRSTGEVDDQLIGESGLVTVGPGTNEFLTRIPVPEYAQVGLSGPDGTPLCTGIEGHLTGLIESPWGLNETKRMRIADGTGVPVVATLEPDRDHDGYGDETQDKCPEQAAIHTACPFVVLRPYATVFRRGILVKVSTGDPTHVQVTGQVSWGYEPRAGGPKKRLVVGLSAGAPREVGTGARVGFWLPLPKSVIRRLGKMTTKEKLKVHLAVVATDAIGHQTHRAMGVRLPGYLKRRPAR